MNRKVLLVVVALGAVAALGVYALLSADSAPAGGSATAARRGLTKPGELPTFRDDTPIPERAPEALEAAPGAAPTAEPDAPKAAARPSGPQRTVAGRVLRASDGTPIEGVEVGYLARLDAAAANAPDPDAPQGTEEETERFVMTTTDALGAFTLQVQVEATQLVLATTRRKQPFALPPGTHDLPDVEIIFDSGFRVAGRVVDEAGAPIPGATVEVSAASDVLSDDAGRFLVKDVAPDPADTVVQATARAPWRVRATADVIVPRDVTALPSVELRLAGSGRIEGRLLQSDGAPAVMARVDAGFLMDAGTDSQATSNLDTSTDEHGAFAIDHVPAGRYLVRAGGKVPHLISMAYSLESGGGGGISLTTGEFQQGERDPEVWAPDVLVEAGRTTRLDLVLPVGARLAGRVLDSAGAPVAGAHVLLERLARWPTPDINGSSITSRDGMRIEARGSDGKGEAVLYVREGRLDTDETGRFEFTGLGAGERRLSATDPAGRLAPLQRGVVLAGGEVLDSFDLVLRTGLVMRSKVTDPNGRPLAGAAVYVKDEGSMSLTDNDLVAHSGDDGVFEARGLTPGSKQISISREGYSWFWGTVDPENPPPAYVLTPAPRLHGEVLDALTGEPVEAFALKIEKDGSSMQTGVQSRPGGTFDEDPSDDERCAVTIDAPGYESLTLEQVLPSATMTTPLRFRLQRQN
jgi:Carboxypeptidase regulatory-like domain